MSDPMSIGGPSATGAIGGIDASASASAAPSTPREATNQPLIDLSESHTERKSVFQDTENKATGNPPNGFNGRGGSHASLPPKHYDPVPLFLQGGPTSGPTSNAPLNGGQDGGPFANVGGTSDSAIDSLNDTVENRERLNNKQQAHSMDLEEKYTNMAMANQSARTAMNIHGEAVKTGFESVAKAKEQMESSVQKL